MGQRRLRIARGVAIAFVLLGTALSYAVRAGRTADDEKYDVVIANGRGWIRNPDWMRCAMWGLAAERFGRFPRAHCRGRRRSMRRGLVVAPGFIDLHEHGQEPRNYQFQAHDGVTTSLELEAGTSDVPGSVCEAGREFAHQLWREYWTHTGAHERAA